MADLGNNCMAFDTISEFDWDQLGDMNSVDGSVSLSKEDLNLFPELSLSEPSSVSEATLGLRFDDDVILDEVTDNEEDLLRYMTNGRDKTSSIGSMSPREDAFEESDAVSPPCVGNQKQPVLKVVRIVRLPGKTGSVKIVDSVDSRNYEDAKGEQSMSKNAIAARENRQKKKAYVQDLEHSVEKVNAENRELRNENEKMAKSIHSLKAEVRYLKSVLANQSTLSGLLRNIGATPGVQFKSSICGDADDESEFEASGKKPSKRFCRKRKFASEDKEQARKENVAHNLRLVGSLSQPKKRSVDHSYVPDNEANSSSDADEEVGGICLHVNKRNVSIEFCSQCSARASAEKTQVR